MSKMSFNLGFIGGGNMSTAIVNGLIKNKAHPPFNIWVSGPHFETLQHWRELGTNVTTENGEVISNCSVVFLGVKPDMLKTAINECLLTMTKQVKSIIVVSMLTGKSIKEVKEVMYALGSSLEIKVIRIMPNTAMMVGHGTCCITPDTDVPSSDVELVKKLLSSCAICETVSESMMDSLGVLTGCGPAFIFMIIEALADGAVKQGASRAIALKMAAQMVVGSGEMVLKTGKHPGTLKDEVCSPGGATICGVTALEDGKVRALMINAIEAASKRNKQMGEMKQIEKEK